MYDFKLSNDFVNTYKDITPPFGFDGLGEFVFIRTYSRSKTNGTKEQWYETVRRVVEGTYSIQKRHIKEELLGWDEEHGQLSAQEMYDRMFYMKFLPPGRGLWSMGSKVIEERGIGAALNNCAFVSTKNIHKNCSEPFEFLMDASMLGVGVGFDTKGKGKINIRQPDPNYVESFIIPDDREGWVQSLRLLLRSYFIDGIPTIKFNYSEIRGAGELIRGFGGVSSGPDPLRLSHEEITTVLERNINQSISSEVIVDIMNIIGKCVVAGNVRRTAELALGSHDDDQFINLKNFKKNPHRLSYGWASNNTLESLIGMDYTKSAALSALDGEPGYWFPQNARMYDRMNGIITNTDVKVDGTNPCAEQSLESWEMCCLVEVFPLNNIDIDDYLRTLKFAYLYAKTVTLVDTQWIKTNRIMKRNRRIGTSITDISRFVELKGLEELKTWLERGYDTIEFWDEIYSDWFAIPKSIKKTTVKPSGTVSLVANATPGVHYPESRYYIRRVRVAKNSPLLHHLNHTGLTIEDDVNDKSSVVVEFAIDSGEGTRNLSDVSLWEQVQLAAFLQRYWSDNQVSFTAVFKEEEKKEIKRVLDYAQYNLKSISFLPKLENGGAYKQMPYEEITKVKYDELISIIGEVNFENLYLSGVEDATGDKYCTTDKCETKELIALN